MKISFKLGIWMLIFYIVGAAMIVYFVNNSLKREALLHAEELSQVILKRNLATHGYFNMHLKPKVFEAIKGVKSKDYFEPVWMSSTYAIREIDNAFKEISGRKYYYKECAINARSPQNEADEFERQFIEDLNSNKSKDKISQIRLIEGSPFYTILIKGETMEGICLRCHSAPDNAPKGLVDKYGAARSFGRYDGEVVSAISIRIPLSEAYYYADRVSLELSVIFLVVLGFISVSYMYMTNKIIIAPVNVLKTKVKEILKDEERLGEQIHVPQTMELRDLASAFNEMSKKLRFNIDHLNALVQERTKALNETNQILEEDIKEREVIESENKNLIAELTEALNSIKQLKGLLPICMRCKKIRDEKGYWQQIEAYIQKHSNAEFTHGICDDCIRELYPKYAERILVDKSIKSEDEGDKKIV